MKTKIWLVTGASTGLGRAIVERAVAHGDAVIATARNLSSLEGIADEFPDRIMAVTLDVTSVASIETAVAAALERFGRIDVLVNNAGFGMFGAFEETPDTELRAAMETMFFGAMNVTRACLPAMRASGDASIVNVSSYGGKVGGAGVSAYVAAKFALEGASECLAAELKDFGIRVLIAEPGQMRTAFGGNSLRFMPEMDAYREMLAPSRRFIEGMDGTQSGDPAKAADALIEVLNASGPSPLRLPLGSDAVDAIRAHADQMLKDLSQWESLSRSIEFDEV